MKNQLLKFYSRKDIQGEIFNSAKNKEFSVRFGETFGKRPDVLEFENDILEFIKTGATSFHLSEEHWSDPLKLQSGMSQKQLDELRTGWDLIIDIDCKYLDYSKFIAHLIIETLKLHGIKTIGCKFSGNKGFHISVPFEAFPKTINNRNITDLFPEAPKRILNYLIYTINSEEKFTKYIKKNLSDEDLIKYFSKKGETPIIAICKKCEKLGNIKIEPTEFSCSKCNIILKEPHDTKYKSCPNCNRLMEKTKIPEFKCTDKHCNSLDYEERFDITHLIDVDSLLVSSRHLYRAPYSFHEKSGLISLPLNPDKILEFEKEQAKIETISKLEPFFKKPKPGEATKLLIQAFDHTPTIVQEETTKKEFRIPATAISEKNFPPSIQQILLGLKDGRKRAAFILLNFLRNVGWDFDSIEKLLKEWNEKNNPSLKWGYIKSQISYQKRQKETILPPNYDNKAYYVDIGIQIYPEEARFKNPVRYALSQAKKKK